MFRVFAVSFFGLAAIASLNAGQITIGGANGLTAAYVASGCSAQFAGQTGLAGYGGCTAGSIGSAGTSGTTFRLFSYSGSLYTGATQNGSFPATPVPAGTVTSADGATFALINDSTSSDGSGLCRSPGPPVCSQWGGSGGLTGTGGAATTTITLPIGIFDVDKAWTMLNDYWGISGAQNTTVTFNFGSTSNATTGLTAVTFNLVNGNEIRSATDCTGSSTSPAPPGSPAGDDYANGTCTSFATTTSSANTSNVFTTQYDGNTDATTPYYNTSGSLNLDDQLFSFGNAYANQWLVSATVTNTGGLPNLAIPTSRTALSAITVNTLASPAPEPSTIFLLMTGLSALGLARFRRKESFRK